MGRIPQSIRKTKTNCSLSSHNRTWVITLNWTNRTWIITLSKIKGFSRHMEIILCHRNSTLTIILLYLRLQWAFRINKACQIVAFSNLKGLTKEIIRCLLDSTKDTTRTCHQCLVDLTKEITHKCLLDLTKETTLICHQCLVGSLTIILRCPVDSIKVKDITKEVIALKCLAWTTIKVKDITKEVITLKCLACKVKDITKIISLKCLAWTSTLTWTTKTIAMRIKVIS